MPEQLAHRVKVNAEGKAERRKGMPRTMEGDVLVDPGPLYPMTNSFVDALLCSQLENRVWHNLANDPRRNLGAVLHPQDRRPLVR